jgi:formyltetrahydrofolate synthetase
VGSRTERRTRFDIAVASEVMAVLALATSYPDLRRRLGRMIVGRTKSGAPVTADGLKGAGAMAVLVRDAFKPNLLQTIENTPAFIHTGPFGNIAHGNSSVVADQLAVRLADFVVTESGFGADLGFEKYMDIKLPAGAPAPSAAAVVATVRACKLHGCDVDAKPGKPLPPELLRENPDAVAKGAENLAHMVGLVRKAGLPAVVLVNRFPDDTDREIDALRKAASGAFAVEVIEAYARGGEGAKDAAAAVARACEQPSAPRRFYELEGGLRDRIRTIAKEVYGADGVDFSERSEAELTRLESWGLGGLAVCMAKTQLSISHDPKLRGRPRGFRVPVHEVRVSAGAGFVTPLLGDIMTMPGLPSSPAAERMDIDERGNLIGVSS